MSKLLQSALVAFSLLSSSALAHATLEFGGRVGYGIPLGDGTTTESSLESNVGAEVPLWLDLGARVTPNFGFLAFASWGFMGSGDRFESVCRYRETGNCEPIALHFRAGLQGQYHLFPDSRGARPWLGMGMGYELVRWGFRGENEGDGQEGEESYTVLGWELVNFQFGVDFPVADKVTAGPFTAFTLSEFVFARTRCSTHCVRCFEQCPYAEDERSNPELDSAALHHWVFLGMRVAVLP